MNLLLENTIKIMMMCMEVMHDTANRMDKASIEISEWAEHAKELRNAADIIQTWIEGIKP